jgi:hypothetical protein
MYDKFKYSGKIVKRSYGSIISNRRTSAIFKDGTAYFHKLGKVF